MKPLQLLALLLLALFSTAASCDKKDKDDPQSAALTLPLTVDFTAASPAPAGKTSFTASGVPFSGAALTSSSYTNGKLNCIASTNAVIRQHNGAIQLAYSDFNCLIADVSKLPAIQKITVRMFDNSGAVLTLCDGSQNLASSTTRTGTNPLVTYTLNVGGKTGSRFYITGSEIDVYSITFE